MDQVIGHRTFSGPIPLSGANKEPFCTSGVPAMARLGRQLRNTSHFVCCQRFPEKSRNCVIKYSLRNEQYLLHALPLEAVTTDNESDCSTPLAESTGPHQAGQSTLFDLRSWYCRARNRPILLTCKQVFERLKAEGQSLDKVYALQQIRWAKSWMRLWERTPPWIQWPLAICIPWFLFITVFYGPSVSMDLLPLWIMGPLVGAFVVKAGIEFSASCRQWAADKKPKETVLWVSERVASGQFERQILQETAGTLMAASKKMSDYVTYVRSGGLRNALRTYMERKRVEVWENGVENYEDWRLAYLRFERYMKNIV